MDKSYSESDVSFSPSQILERLQVLRQLQLMQRGKLQKQYLETSESSSSITEIVSQFTNSSSYDTFRRLLQDSNDNSNEVSPRLKTSDLAKNVDERDLIEGVSVLNLSQESEFILTSPISSTSRASAKSQETLKRYEKQEVPYSFHNTPHENHLTTAVSNNGMALTEAQTCPDNNLVQSSKKDFEQLMLEKLKNEIIPSEKVIVGNKNKKPFLKRGEGIARFGLKKNSIVIQNTKSLPWKKKTTQKLSAASPLKQNIKNKQIKSQHNFELQPLTSDFKVPILIKKNMAFKCQDQLQQSVKIMDKSIPEDNVAIKPLVTNESPSNECNITELKAIQKIDFSKNKHPLVINKGKTWAALLTKEQNDFLSQLKQSDYYKNFTSPTKSVVSDVSYDETMCKLQQDREMAEQNMFELLENKVNHDSFNLENSFINHFLKNNNFEYSGESTPLVFQKCLSKNPSLVHIHPGLKRDQKIENSHSDAESCCSSCSNCYSVMSSSVSCCSCKTVEHTANMGQSCIDDTQEKSSKQKSKKGNLNQKEVDKKKDHNVSLTEDDKKANIAEMNSKLIATSELLKDRLHELEDEIETFRKENDNLAKLREDLEQDRQKFYADKSAFEHKINEEKVLAEYYLAEEKDKLSKQKQMYDRYVREIRGRLNKKDKDEVATLKMEISGLKEEIRIKDVKLTSTIARLRNQLKIMEKEKKDLQQEVDKLQKANRRIQHNNEITRRLTNLKYLEEINKKLNKMSKNQDSEIGVDGDMKYKSYEIERQTRSRKTDKGKGTVKTLTKSKSVPNLNVTSRYAKYFSQRDTSSQINQTNMNINRFSNDDYLDDHDDIVSNKSIEDVCSENEDYLEKIYVERFQTNSPKSNRSSGSSSNDFIDKPHLNESAKDFFIQKSKSNSARNSKSPRTIISPSNIDGINISRSKSPVSIASNKSSNNLISNCADYISSHSSSNNSLLQSHSALSAFNYNSQSATVIHNKQYSDKLMSVSPEPAISKSSLTKTNLNPTETRKVDGSRELRFPNGNVKYLSADGKYSRFIYYNGDIKENFYNEGRIKYFYAETKIYHTTHADGLEVLEFPDGQVEKRYKDGSSEIRLPNGSIRYFDPKNKHVREEWRFPDGSTLSVSANGERRIMLSNGQIEVHAKDHKRREFPDGTVKLVYNDGTSETRYASGRVRIKDKLGNLIMDSAPG